MTMTLRIQVQAGANRQKVIEALADSGYFVKVEEVEDPDRPISGTKLYVTIVLPDVKQESIGPNAEELTVDSPREKDSE